MSYEFSFRPLAEILYAALDGDPFYATLEAAAPGDAAERREAMLRYLDYSMLEAKRHGILCVSAGERLAVAVWSKPVDPGLANTIAAQKESFLARHIGPGYLDAYSSITANMHRATAPFVDEASWYLSIIGVSPEAQGRGLGTVVMLETLEAADAAGVATYLETFTARNKPFYARLGYEDRAGIDEPVTGAEYSVMVRPCGHHPGTLRT